MRQHSIFFDLFLLVVAAWMFVVTLHTFVESTVELETNKTRNEISQSE